MRPFAALVVGDRRRVRLPDSVDTLSASGPRGDRGDRGARHDVASASRLNDNMVCGHGDDNTREAAELRAAQLELFGEDLSVGENRLEGPRVSCPRCGATSPAIVHANSGDCLQSDVHGATRRVRQGQDVVARVKDDAGEQPSRCGQGDPGRVLAEFEHRISEGAREEIRLSNIGLELLGRLPNSLSETPRQVVERLHVTTLSDRAPHGNSKQRSTTLV